MSDYIRILLTTLVFCLVTTQFWNLKKPARNNNTDCYIVKAPDILKYLYFIVIGLGLIMLVIFSFFKMQDNQSVTTGHIYFAIVIVLIGELLLFLHTAGKSLLMVI